MTNHTKLILLGGFLLLLGCASTATNIGNNLYRTSCGGIANGWSSCYEAAKVQCTKGFIERDRKQINHPGEYNSLCLCMIYPISRDLVFSCST
jgi:hypothetical protein